MKMWTNEYQTSNPAKPRYYQVSDVYNPNLVEIREVMKTGDYAFAVSLLRTYIKINGNANARESLFLLGVCHYAEWNFSDALKFLEMLSFMFPRLTNEERMWLERVKAKVGSPGDMRWEPKVKRRQVGAPSVGSNLTITSRYQHNETGSRYQNNESGSRYVSRRKESWEINGNCKPGYLAEEMDDDMPIL